MRLWEVRTVSLTFVVVPKTPRTTPCSVITAGEAARVIPYKRVGNITRDNITRSTLELLSADDHDDFIVLNTPRNHCTCLPGNVRRKAEK